MENALLIISDVSSSDSESMILKDSLKNVPHTSNNELTSIQAVDLMQILLFVRLLENTRIDTTMCRQKSE